MAALNHAHKAPKELDVEIIGVKAISLFSYYSPLVMLVSASFAAGVVEGIKMPIILGERSDRNRRGGL